MAEHRRETTQDPKCSSRDLNQVPGGPEHGLTWDPGKAAEMIAELGLKGWNEKDRES